MPTAMTCAAHREVDRVREHFRGALAAVGSRDLSTSPRLVRLTRRLLLRELRRYRRAGQFPKNRTHPETMTPVFVDAEGTRCAVAHLMEVGGASTLVHRIARERNFARVRELADLPEFVAWLEAAGLTVEEAAVIQPAYCHESRSTCVCLATTVTSKKPTAVARVEVLANEGNATEYPYEKLARARVDAVYPDGADLIGAEIQIATFSDARTQLALLEPTPTERLGGFDDAGVTPKPTRAIGFDDGIPCSTEFAKRHPLTFEQVAKSLVAKDCDRELASVNAGWAESKCSDDDGSGCGVADAHGRDGSPTATILLALLGLIAARRAVARSS